MEKKNQEGGRRPRISAGSRPVHSSSNSYSRAYNPESRQRSSEGGYQRREGGYQSHSEGGYQRREGGYGYHGRSEGGYQHREGGYQGRSEGGYRHREGGYQSHREGGYQPRREGGYQSRREGGYQGRSEGGYQRRDGGSRPYQGRGKGGNFGGKGGFRKQRAPQKFSETALGQMIERKEQDVRAKLQDSVATEPMAPSEIRLNKFIANSGVCSRREADELIQAGVITVNGEVVTELGTKVNIYSDEVKYDGTILKGEEMVYIVMNKPAGYVTTASDPHAEKTVYDLLKGCKSRVFPVGRLDKNTTGVLLFTNDGQIAERLTHPSYDKKKIYQVGLDSKLSQEDFDKILSGVELEDGVEGADALEYLDPNDHRKVGIEIHSGKNRIVRRMFESLGYRVKVLDRVYFAGLTKKNVKKGEWRYLSQGEVNILKMGAYI